MASPEDTKPVLVKAEELPRIDRMAEKLEAKTGGDFSRGRVVSRALDLLEKELAEVAT